jgi:hypothetical protein
LASALEFGSVANLIEHVIVVHRRVDAEIAFGVGFEQAKSRIFLVEPCEEGGAEVPGIGIGKLEKFGYGLRDDAIAVRRG